MDKLIYTAIPLFTLIWAIYTFNFKKNKENDKLKDDAIHDKIDSTEKNLKTKIEDSQKYLTERLDNTEKQFTKAIDILNNTLVEIKILTTHFEHTEKTLEAIDIKYSKLEEKVNNLQQIVGKLEGINGK